MTRRRPCARRTDRGRINALLDAEAARLGCSRLAALESLSTRAGIADLYRALLDIALEGVEEIDAEHC